MRRNVFISRNRTKNERLISWKEFPSKSVGRVSFQCLTVYVHSSIAIILVGKRELVALLNLSSWCLMMVERLFLAVLWG